MKRHFVIVNRNDVLIYEYTSQKVQEDDTEHLNNQFILHASLDIVDIMARNISNNYLKAVEKLRDATISAYVTPSGTRFLLLHDTNSEDNIKSFFLDIHEILIKEQLNPFLKENEIIKSPHFDNKVKKLIKRIE